MLSKKGRFIVFEGGEGAGKSTQIRRLENFLKMKNIPTELTMEPGGSPLGLALRKIIINPETGSLDSRTEALLFAAGRAEHVAKKIRPALEKGVWVLCDRYMDASKAYQGVGRGLGMTPLTWINEWATEGLYADRTYLLDIPVEDGLLRAKNRAQSSQGALDRIEKEELSFHKKIREAYLFLARSHAEKYKLLDARLSAEEIQKNIESDLSEKFL